MKTKTMQCDCGGCVNELKLIKHKSASKVMIEMTHTPIRLSLYKLLRLKEWIGGAIIEIEKSAKSASKK